jgi:hypothetical protein
MPKAEVRDILDSQAWGSITGWMTIGSKSAEGHSVEVIHVYKTLKAPDGEERVSYEYYLYFLDDRLVDWGPPGNWEQTAERLLEESGS